MAAGGGAPSAEPGAGSLVGQAAAGGVAGAAGAGRVPRSAKVPATAVTTDREAPEPLRQDLGAAAERPESVQHWHTDKAHLENLLDVLSTPPGVHAVHLSDGDV
ncbi:hypothetical protein [Mycobacterium sp. SMC-14]|uniref:hypothetical protein n=1 Tax=Mycobacterium sp. SMC-14 TaxID=3385968 RepID=UPI00390C7FB4